MNTFPLKFFHCVLWPLVEIAKGKSPAVTDILMQCSHLHHLMPHSGHCLYTFKVNLTFDPIN